MKKRLSIFSGLFGMALLLVPAKVSSARTIALSAEDCDEMAVISARAPKSSWAVPHSPGTYTTAYATLLWSSDMAVLLRFPFADLIPKGQRITKAELTIAPNYKAGPPPEVHVHRILAEWGNGVSHQYRMTHPQKLEWTQPGCRGAATDRANKDSAVFRIEKLGENTVDVTEDVELWYTGAVANRGWVLTLEPEGCVFTCRRRTVRRDSRGNNGSCKLPLNRSERRVEKFVTGVLFSAPAHSARPLPTCGPALPSRRVRARSAGHAEPGAPFLPGCARPAPAPRPWFLPRPAGNLHSA